MVIDFASQFVRLMLMNTLDATNSEGICAQMAVRRGVSQFHNMHHTYIITRTITQWNHVPIGLYALCRAHNCRVRVPVICQSHWNQSSDDIHDGGDA